MYNVYLYLFVVCMHAYTMPTYMHHICIHTYIPITHAQLTRTIHHTVTRGRLHRRGTNFLIFLILFWVSAPDPRTSYANESCHAVMRGRYIHIYPPRTHNSHEQSTTQLRVGAYIAVVTKEKNILIFSEYMPLTPGSHANDSCHTVMRGRYIHIYPSRTHNSHE